LGYPHPDYLLNLLTEEQFREWMAFYNEEPFGFWERDIQFAFTRKFMADVSGAKYKDGKAISIEDVSLSKLMEPRKEQSVDEMKSLLMMLAGVATEGEEGENGGR